MIDDGILGSHEEFGGRVADVAFDLDNHGAPTGSHGTRVASVAAGEHFGPAKDAVVVDVHAFNDPRTTGTMRRAWSARSSGSWSSIRGSDRASWGGNSWELAISRGQAGRHAPHFQALIDAGIHVAIAAGNSGEELDLETSFINGPFHADVPGLIWVGATTEDDAGWERSTYGEYVEIHAPGHEARIATTSGGEEASENSGTSYAHPLVADVIACMLEANPDLTPPEVREILLDTATTDAIAGLDGDSHNRLVYAPAAIEAAEARR